MQQTGIEFDMNPETFTLQNIFAMELSRFVDDIGDTLNTAVKEAAIEKGIKYVEVPPSSSTVLSLAVFILNKLQLTLHRHSSDFLFKNKKHVYT